MIIFLFYTKGRYMFNIFIFLSILLSQVWGLILILFIPLSLFFVIFADIDKLHKFLLLNDKHICR